MEDDDDAVYDEIDRFHLKKDKSTLDLVIHKRKRRIKEVLSVRVDDDEDLGFGQEETEIEETSNKWGRTRKNFYGTSYVDHDFGGVNNSDEDELLDMELKDAVKRQAKQNSLLAYVNLDDVTAKDVEDCEGYFYVEKEQPAIVNVDIKKRKPSKSSDKTTQNKNEEEPKRSVNDEERKEMVLGDLDEKRSVTYEIMKNKGLTEKRRKDSKHARIKNRRSYKKALKRRRSQVPDVRREIQKYDGEKRGIRASTVRSIKLQ